MDFLWGDALATDISKPNMAMLEGMLRKNY